MIHFHSKTKQIFSRFTIEYNLTFNGNDIHILRCVHIILDIINGCPRKPTYFYSSSIDLFCPVDKRYIEANYKGANFKPDKFLLSENIVLYEHRADVASYLRSIFHKEQPFLQCFLVCIHSSKRWDNSFNFLASIFACQKVCHSNPYGTFFAYKFQSLENNFWRVRLRHWRDH